jgi:hypothetical protein
VPTTDMAKSHAVETDRIPAIQVRDLACRDCLAALPWLAFYADPRDAVKNAPNVPRGSLASVIVARAKNVRPQFVRNIFRLCQCMCS